MCPFLGFGESAEVRSRWVLHNLIGAGAGSEIDVPRGTNSPTALVCGRKLRVARGLACLRPSTVWGPTLVGVLHGMPGGDGCSQRVLQGRVPSHETRRVRGGHHQGVLSIQQADVPRGTFVNVRGGLRDRGLDFRGGVPWRRGWRGASPGPGCSSSIVGTGASWLWSSTRLPDGWRVPRWRSKPLASERPKRT